MNGTPPPQNGKIARSDISKQKFLTIDIDDLQVSRIHQKSMVIEAPEIMNHPKVQVLRTEAITIQVDPIVP